MSSTKVIILGGGSGGVKTVCDVLATLEPDLPAAVIVVLHLSQGTSPTLRSTVSNAGPLPADFVQEQQSLEPGKVLIAPPDKHLLFQGERVVLSRGPRVNSARPSLDLALRSAAVSLGERVIGVILSGMLDDGIAGLEAVRACGGKALVQTPTDALYPELPENVLAFTEVDFMLPAAELGRKLCELAAIDLAEKSEIPARIKNENELDGQIWEEFPLLQKVGHQVPLSCPLCQGCLWEMKESKPARFRCRIGHTFTLQTLIKMQDENLEKILLTAFRCLEEKAETQELIAQCHLEHDQHGFAQVSHRQASVTRNKAERLRRMLLD